MQIPYDIIASLSIYYMLVNSGKWNLPDFSDKCPICGAKNCAIYLGIYRRFAENPLENFSVTDLPVLRYLCQGKGAKKKSDHKTFSLLPYQLMPYRQLTVQFMVLSVFIKLKTRLSRIKVLNKIERVYTNPGDIAPFLNECALYQWELLITDAFERFMNSEFCKSPLRGRIIKSADPQERLIEFLKFANIHKARCLSAPTRGADGLAFDFYRSSDGPCQLAPFLFGVASQHRK